jgi:ABC-type nitrate/sulfonate/bicarbonate transport system ATPase subunit
MIEFHDTTISLSHDGRRRLSIGFRLSKGDLTVLLGANGSGKTTILDLIAGARKPDTGTVTTEPAGLPVAYAVQDSSSGLLPWRTILSNILLPSVVANRCSEQNRSEALRLLEQFGLAERRQDFPYQLSEGEKQIVNLIRAVCTPAEILLLDEPFSSLNSRTRALAKEKLLQFASNRTTILVTHDPTDLEMPFNRFLRIADSSVEEVDSKEATSFLRNAVSET